MANELKLQLSAIFSKGGAYLQKKKSINVDVSGDDYTDGTQVIGTSEETLAIGADIASLGYVIITNLDSANFVEVGHATGVYGVKVSAGGFAVYEHNGSTIYMKADTAPVRVGFSAFEA